MPRIDPSNNFLNNILFTVDHVCDDIKTLLLPGCYLDNLSTYILLSIHEVSNKRQGLAFLSKNH